MSRFIGFLIIVGGFVGVYFLYEDYAAKRKSAHNRWVDDIKPLIAEHFPNPALDGSEDGWFASESSFFRILGLMKEAETHKYNAFDTVKAACTSAGAAPGVGRMMADELEENYKIAKELGVFDDLANRLRLERGEAPMCKAKGWDGEPLKVGYILPHTLAPEASRSLVNMVLMPKGMRDMQTDEPVSFTISMAKKWLSERVINPQSHRLIMDYLAKRP